MHMKTGRLRQCIHRVTPPTSASFTDISCGLDSFKVLTDDKPLVPLMNQKNLDEVPMFGSLGLMACKPIKIMLKSSVEPYSVHVAHRVLIPMPQIKQQLDRMEQLGLIEEVSEPTPWCAPMVSVTKRNGDISICVDLKQLNEAVIREKYVLPTLNGITSKLGRFFPVWTWPVVSGRFC